METRKNADVDLREEIMKLSKPKQELEEDLANTQRELWIKMLEYIKSDFKENFEDLSSFLSYDELVVFIARKNLNLPWNKNPYECIILWETDDVMREATIIGRWK